MFWNFENNVVKHMLVLFHYLLNCTIHYIFNCIKLVNTGPILLQLIRHILYTALINYKTI